MSSNLSVGEVIDGLSDWLGDGVNSIYEEEMFGDEPAVFEPMETTSLALGAEFALCTGYRIVVETTDGLKPSWMPTEIGCFQIVVKKGGPYDAENV